ncbi:hypothetical protein GCM10027431_12070 [Lysobacter rhizosphaerae]
MNSKLRNSLSAFAASCATLAIALMVAVPAGNTPVQDVVSQDLSPASATRQRASEIDSLAKAVALSAEIAAASALALESNSGMDAQAKQRMPLQGSRHRRQTVVMPYFSFSPRG